ncbi:MAG: cupin domain-containing protein [Abitibacteriaceae bacterium]|nr:cupin domain-containing protein [Abditibacteriaceae bacterium]
MDIIQRNKVEAFTTMDGSEIRELLHPRHSVVRNQSLAEATLPVDGATCEHFHPLAEEIYYILQGEARMRIEGEERLAVVGDAIAIPAGQRHKIWNTGAMPLVFLCCCAPAYSDEDTVLTEPQPGIEIPGREAKADRPTGRL